MNYVWNTYLIVCALVGLSLIATYAIEDMMDPRHPHHRYNCLNVYSYIYLFLVACPVINVFALAYTYVTVKRTK